MLFQWETPSSDAPARGKSQNSRQKESKTEQNEG